jgi:hypothetical protein
MSSLGNVRLRVSYLFLSLCLGLSGWRSHAASGPPEYSYGLEFSTYFGGSGNDLIRGIDVDATGNIYVVGVAGSADFPRTPGNLAGETKEGGSLVAKFSPQGRLIWSKVIDGKGYLYSVKVDSKGYIFVAGRAGPGFPTTPGALQERTAHICGFAAKLKPDASAWVWATYVGTGYAVRDMTIDDKGDIYGILDYFAESKDILPAAWFAHAFHKTPQGGGNHFGKSDAGVIKISSEGKAVWATWIGGSNGNDWVGSLGVGSDHAPVVFLNTYSTDMPVTTRAFCKTPSPGGWLGKLSPDGSHLMFGTYTCGAPVGPRTHNVALDSHGNIFIGFCTPSLSAVTPGAFQNKFGGGPEDYGIEKISPAGALLAATFIGGNGDEINGPDQVLVDRHDNVMIVGSSSSTDYPVTAGAFQKQNKGYFDGVVSLLSNDLGKLLYSSYFGGNSDDFIRASVVGRDGTLYLAGVTGSNNWRVKNAYQMKYAGPPGLQNMGKDWGNGDGVVVKLSPR